MLLQTTVVGGVCAFFYSHEALAAARAAAGGCGALGWSYVVPDHEARYLYGCSAALALVALAWPFSRGAPTAALLHATFHLSSAAVQLQRSLAWGASYYDCPTLRAPAIVSIDDTTPIVWQAFMMHALAFACAVATASIALRDIWSSDDGAAQTATAPMAASRRRATTPRREPVHDAPESSPISAAVESDRAQYALALDAMSYRELQAEAKRRGVRANGKKIALVAALLEAVDAPSAAADASDVDGSASRRERLLLFPGRPLAGFTIAAPRGHRGKTPRTSAKARAKRPPRGSSENDSESSNPPAPAPSSSSATAAAGAAEEEDWSSPAIDSVTFSRIEAACAGEEVDGAALSHLGADVKKQWHFVRQLGESGKDGAVYLVRSTRKARSPTWRGAHSKEWGAMKVFKRGKAVGPIAKEVALQRRAAAAGVAPDVISTWKIDAAHKCFVMEPLAATLLDVVEEQGNTVTMSQRDRIVALFRRLSSEAEILHNDENVGRNIMTDARGRFFLIDFGFSSTITAKQRAKSGPLPNLALLSRVDALLAKDARVFAPIVRAYEAEHGVRIDARYWGKQAGKARAAKLVAKLRAKAAASR